MKTTVDILSVNHTQAEITECTKQSVDSFHYLIKVLSQKPLNEVLAHTDALTDAFMANTPLKLVRQSVYAQLVITQLASLVCQKAAISSNQPIDEYPPVTGQFDTSYLIAPLLSDTLEPFSSVVVSDRSFGALAMLMKQYCSVRGLLQVWFYDTDPKATAIHNMLSNIAELEENGKILNKDDVQGVLDPQLLMKVTNQAIEELFVERILSLFSTDRNEGATVLSSATIQ